MKNNFSKIIRAGGIALLFVIFISLTATGGHGQVPKLIHNVKCYQTRLTYESKFFTHSYNNLTIQSYPTNFTARIDTGLMELGLTLTLFVHGTEKNKPTPRDVQFRLCYSDSSLDILGVSEEIEGSRYDSTKSIWILEINVTMTVRQNIVKNGMYNFHLSGGLAIVIETIDPTVKAEEHGLISSVQLKRSGDTLRSDNPNSNVVVPICLEPITYYKLVK